MSTIAENRLATRPKRAHRITTRTLVASCFAVLIATAGCGGSNNDADGDLPGDAPVVDTATTSTIPPVANDYAEVFTTAPPARLTKIESSPINVPGNRIQLVSSAAVAALGDMVAPKGYKIWVGEFEVDPQANPLPVDADTTASVLLDRGNGAMALNEFTSNQRTWLALALRDKESGSIVLSAAGSEAEVSIPKGTTKQGTSFSRTVQRTALNLNQTTNAPMSNADGKQIEATLSRVIDEASIWDHLPTIADPPAGSGLLVLTYSKHSLDYSTPLEDTKIELTPGSECTITADGVSVTESKEGPSNVSIFVVPLTFTTGELTCPTTFAYTTTNLFGSGGNSGTLRFEPLVGTISLG